MVEIENDAFFPEPHEELSRILKELSSKLSSNKRLDQPIHDINGNKVGRLKIVACKQKDWE